MNKIILYGIGQYLDSYKKIIFSLPNTKIVGIVDSNSDLWGVERYGFAVCAFEAIHEYYDYIVISSIYAVEIQKVLIQKGVPKGKIKRLKEFIGLVFNGKWKEYNPPNDESSQKTKSAVVIDHVATFNGACLAALYFLEELAKKDYKVGMIAPKGDDEFIRYANSRGIKICIYPNIEFSRYKEFEWIKQFELIILNTFLVQKCVNNLHYEKMIWWIHESDSAYMDEIRLWGSFIETEYTNLPIYCVSDMALKTFNTYFPHLIAKKMEYGIPDFYNKGKQFIHRKMIFAIIGYLSQIKGQDVLIDSIIQLDKSLLDRCEFLIIGKEFDNVFCKDLKVKSTGLPIKFLGEMSHEKIEELYPQIDVVISASRQDSLPIAITEALMNEKIAVMSDVIGMCGYVENGKSAFIFKNENSKDLARIIDYIIKHSFELDYMKKAGRKVYMDNFSMESFSERLDKLNII